MAWDKVTKVDSIAKRKAWTRENLGKLIEHKGSVERAAQSGRAAASFAPVRGNTQNQMSVTLSKRGRLHRRIGSAKGPIGTNWPVDITLHAKGRNSR
jgi:hypothetical protein